MSKLPNADTVMEAFGKVGKGDHIGIRGINWTARELAEAYPGAAWWMLCNPPFGEVLQVTLDLGGERGLLWESFANVDGDQRHTVHFLYEKWPGPRLWEQRERSADKPDAVIGRQWYAYRLPDMTPYRIAMRRQGGDR